MAEEPTAAAAGSRRFLLYVHTGRASALRALSQVLAALAARGVRAAVTSQQLQEIQAADPSLRDPDLLDQLADDSVDIVDRLEPGCDEIAIVLGGDGTILRALEITRDVAIPVHGVNLGHVGFLAESEVENLGTTVQRLLAGDYVLEKRSTLTIDVFDAEGKKIAEHWALNEASLEKADRQKMVYVVVEIDSRPVSSFGCDGMLLSTSTGSTAYAFSAGGPVIWPEVDSFVVLPLAAHALFARPLVLGRSSEVAIEITMDNTADAVLTMDGRRSMDLHAGMRIEAVLSPNSVELARLATTPFADRLVEKFKLPVEGWRGRDVDEKIADRTRQTETGSADPTGAE